MKKSFMTRALATGLSLAMAFSLTAATNVTTAAAAAKPAMKASNMTVKEGKSRTYLATAKTLKTYKITKAKVKNASAKQYISVKKNAKGTGIVVTGKKGGDTARKIVITFQNKKTKKTTTLNTKVVVKAAAPVEEKLTMTASVTGVKTIVLDFNKAIASPSAVKVTVKKGTAARDCKATVDGSKITLAMAAKLTAGAYTVSVEGVDTAAMTADVNVEKDETLTSYEISSYIVAKGLLATTEGSIKYAALNQYGEKMVANDPTPMCSFGTASIDKSATASAEGVIKVTNINPILAIEGTKGTVTLVGDMGVTATKDITYSAFAKAVKAEVIGTYHVNSATLKDLKEGDKKNEYELLLQFTDQYDYTMSADELLGVTVTIAGGLTGINTTQTQTDFKTRTYNGTDYVAVSLATAADTSVMAAGDATLMVNNNYYGSLINDKLTVAKNVVIKNMSVTANNGVYWGQDNDMDYEFTDAEGKSVTSYATIKNCSISLPIGFRWERQKDGSAKLIYNPSTTMSNPSQPNTDKASMPQAVVFYANSPSGGDYLVKTCQFTVYQSRFAKGVTGIADDTTTSISKKSTGALSIDSKKIVLADQYSNKIVSTESMYNASIFDTTVKAAVSGTAVYIATNGAFTTSVAGNKIVATPTAIGGTATVYLKYKVATVDTAVTASTTNYDAKFTITAYDTTGVDASTIVIDSINDGFAMTTTDAKALNTNLGKITVKAVVGGVKTVVPASQYVVVKNENNDFSAEDTTKGVKTKTAKLTVQVTTWDSANTPIETQITKEYTVSREDSKLFKVTNGTNVNTAASPGSIASNTDFKADTFITQFKFRDQYGNGGSDGSASSSITGIVGTLDTGCVNYTIEMVEAAHTNGYTITSNGTNSANIIFTETGKYTYKVTATTPDGSSKSYTAYVNVNS